jgi:hypothetical protein
LQLAEPRPVTKSAKVSPSKRNKLPPQEKTTTIRYYTPTHMYGVPLAPHNPADDKAVCAGCLGSKNQELVNEPTVLCDGKKCGREYHLSCCLPRLELGQIPEGSYLCIDCDPEGSSSQLELYFADIAEARSNFSTSREYIESLFQGHRIPVSEVQRVAELHRDAIATVNPMLLAASSASSQDTPEDADALASVNPNVAASSSSQDTLVGADFLIGKPLRLYCPEGNAYHDGRIIDWRRATHLRPITSSPPQYDRDFLFGTMSEIARCEFLVSFSAGLNYRKRTVHQWIILEEHSLAVGTSLIWCFPSKKEDWVPGITWLRTSLELIPVLEMLSESEGEVRYVDSKIGQTNSKRWSLTQIYGAQTHMLLLLREQSADFFSPSFSERFQKSNEDGGIDIPMMLAYTEAEEQRRIRRWFRLPLQNALHEKALTIADEYMLPPLEVKPTPDSSKEKSAVVSLGPRPCPLIRQGLDRMWIMDQVEGGLTSKDTAASLSCQRVKSRAEAIRQLQEKAKVGTTTAS